MVMDFKNSKNLENDRKYKTMQDVYSYFVIHNSLYQ